MYPSVIAEFLACINIFPHYKITIMRTVSAVFSRCSQLMVQFHFCPSLIFLPL